MNNKRTYLLLFSVVMIFTQSCLSIARLSEFSQTAKGYDFNKISGSKKPEKDKVWNAKTGFEYYLKAKVSDDSLIIKAITGAMLSQGFSIEFVDKNAGTVLGERGLRANEWKSVVGVYYQKNKEGCEMYVNCKITQDITGGWREDRAKKIGELICELLKNCLQSYSVNTTLPK